MPSHNERLIAATPDQVWAVLADGWLYPLWVVGATRMRAVDGHWPQEGARLHHSVGSWPVMLDDTTEVLTAAPPSLLELRARAWPGGDAHVRLTLEPVGARTRVHIEEDAHSGPGRLVPGPLRRVPLRWRNVETLTRLALLVEGRTRPADRTGTTADPVPG